ncbi:polyphosphate kinase 2 [Rhodococcus sp. NPDC003348]
MGKKHGGKHGDNHGGGGKKHDGTPDSNGDELLAPGAEPPPDRMKYKEYRRLLVPLQAELVAMQEWVRTSGAKICIVFEGRDTAGKGGVIKAITERVSPRVFRVIALPAPTEREKSQMYIQRYVPHLPAAGEVIIFDRSWYNRAGVERVMGFCTEDQSLQFLEAIPAVERTIVESGVILLKYWLEISEEEQTLRLQSRIDDPRKIWKLSDLDLESYTRWYDYSRARDDMFRLTDTGWAPWFLVNTDDKKRGRLNVISHLLDQVPYETPEHRDVELPPRQSPHGYQPTHQPLHWIPTPY